ncbi:unnamed protein product [Musa hybrid cultivar]
MPTLLFPQTSQTAACNSYSNSGYRTLQLFMKDIQVPGVIVTPLHNQEAPFRALNLVQWAGDNALSAEAPPDSAARGPTGSSGVLAGERDGAAEPVAGVGDGVHRLESREPGGGGAAALRQGRQVAAAAFGFTTLGSASNVWI